MNELEEKVCCIIFHWWLEENGLFNEWIDMIRNQRV